MKDEGIRDDMSDLIYLVSCAVNETIPDAERVRDMDLAALFAAASGHMLAAAAAAALASAGVHDARFERAATSSLLRNAQMDTEMDTLFLRLEEAGIWYMPLKGVILQDLYPSYGMREMADRDILFDADRAEDVRAVMEDLGFRTESFGETHHDCYIKEPVCNFELHRVLFNPAADKGISAYFDAAAERLLTDGCKKRFTPEDHYLFLIAHEYKHFARAGTGLRSILDTYVYLKNTALDMAYVSAELEKLGIADFEAANRSLALHLFGDGELTEADRDMLDYILSSGVYGTEQHRYENRFKNRFKNSGRSRLGYMLRRFFVPISKKKPDYEAFAEQYPVFYRYRILLPLLPFYRLCRSLAEGRFAVEAKAIGSAKKG